MWISKQRRAVIRCLRCQTWIDEWADVDERWDQVCERLEREARKIGWIPVGWTGWGLCSRCVAYFEGV